MTSQRLSDSVLLFLPLCPSTNRRMGVIRMGAFCRQILTKEARDYIEGVSESLKWWVKAEKFRPIADYTRIELWFILPRTSCDSSNFGKVLYDALEAGGVVVNDKFILPAIMGIWHDTKTPQAIVKLPVWGSEKEPWTSPTITEAR